MTLRLHDLHHAFGPRPTLSGLSWSLQPGQIGVILGRSGCGKTTLLNVIAGLIAPSRGSVEIDGQSVNNTPPHQRRVAVGFQSDPLYPHRTLGQMLDRAARVGGRIGSVWKAQTIAQRLEIDDCLDAYPHQVSGGQRQRASMGKAILQNARVCLLDEPLASVDAVAREHQIELLQQIHRDYGEGRIIVHVTHDGEEAMRIADVLAVMHHGQIVQTGTPVSLWSAPETRTVAESLGRPPAQWLPRDQVSEFQSARFDLDRPWDGLMVRPNVCQWRSQRQATSDSVWIELPATMTATRSIGHGVLLETMQPNGRPWQIVAPNGSDIPGVGDTGFIRFQAIDAMPVRDDR